MGVEQCLAQSSPQQGQHYQGGRQVSPELAGQGKRCNPRFSSLHKGAYADLVKWRWGESAHPASDWRPQQTAPSTLPLPAKPWTAPPTRPIAMPGQFTARTSLSSVAAAAAGPQAAGYERLPVEGAVRPPLPLAPPLLPHQLRQQPDREKGAHPKPAPSEREPLLPPTPPAQRSGSGGSSSSLRPALRPALVQPCPHTAVHIPSDHEAAVTQRLLWHAQQEAPTCLELLQSGVGGLTEEEAAHRLRRYGPNAVATQGVAAWYR